jgi:hypothetical protein
MLDYPHRHEDVQRSGGTAPPIRNFSNNDRAIAQAVRPCRSSAVRRWLPTAAAPVRVRAACGICGGQSGTGAGFLRVFRIPLPIIPPISPLS